MLSISTVVAFTLAACSSPDRQSEGSAGSTSQADLGDRCGANRTLVAAGASCAYAGVSPSENPSPFVYGYTAVGKAVQQGSPPADYVDCSYTMVGCAWGFGKPSTTTTECITGTVLPACPAAPSAKISQPTVNGVVLPVPDGQPLRTQAALDSFCMGIIPAANWGELVKACTSQTTSQNVASSTCCVPRTTPDAGGGGGDAQSGTPDGGGAQRG